MTSKGSVQAKEVLKALLVTGVIPATGCTEVGAVALATGWAVRALAGPVDEIEEIGVEVDAGTYRNAFGTGIPGTAGTGLGFAAAMGAFSAERVLRGFQILENPDTEAVRKARALIAENKIRIMRCSDSREILVRARVRNSKDVTTAVILGSHDHLVGVEKNGKPYNGAPARGEDFRRLVQRVKNLKYDTIIDFVRESDVTELPVVKQAMEMNMHFAEEAKKRVFSLRIGKVMRKYVGQGVTEKDLSAKARFITALAVEARMKGLDLPAMACAGSGNQGLVATIPVVEAAKIVGASEVHLMQALTLSYLTTIYIKTYTGLLSPICGCAVAAAVGAGCGMVFLLGGDVSQIEAQIHNMIGTMAGIICDGAKSGCALKAFMAVGLAIDSIHLSLENGRIASTDGIVGREIIDTLRNLQRIIKLGMSSVDSAIVEIMEEKGPSRR